MLADLLHSYVHSAGFAIGITGTSLLLTCLGAATRKDLDITVSNIKVISYLAITDGRVYHAPSPYPGRYQKDGCGIPD